MGLYFRDYQLLIRTGSNSLCLTTTSTRRGSPNHSRCSSMACRSSFVSVESLDELFNRNLEETRLRWFPNTDSTGTQSMFQSSLYILRDTHALQELVSFHCPQNTRPKGAHTCFAKENLKFQFLDSRCDHSRLSACKTPSRCLLVAFRSNCWASRMMKALSVSTPSKLAGWNLTFLCSFGLQVTCALVLTLFRV